MGRVLVFLPVSVRAEGRRGVLLLAGLSLLFFTPAFAEQIQKKFAVIPNASLLLHSHNGNISIKGWDQNEIEVRGERPEAVEVAIAGDEQKVTVQTHLGRKNLSPQQAEVNFEVRVPRQATVRVEAERGTIAIDGIEGTVTVEGVSSDVKLSRLKGNVTARTLDGPITIQASEGHIKADSISGDMNFLQVNGSELVGNTNSGVIRYEGDFGSGGTYVLNNYSSPIHIVTSDRASFDLTARAVQGVIENDLTFRPVPLGSPLRSSTQGKFLQGRFNTGASTVKVTSYSGTIRVQSRRSAAAGAR